jgi:phage recombination protein Bet
MSTTEIAHRTSELAIEPAQTRFTDVQVAALRHLGLQGQDADNDELQFSDADLQVFFHQCQRTGLDPFARQIYMIMRQEFGRPKPTIQTGIDGFRKIGRDAARRYGDTCSKKRPIWLDDDGNEFKVWNRPEPPAAAMVNIVVNGDDNEATVNYREYVQRKRNGEPNSMWMRMGANQLAKCAEAAAWRMAYPSDFAGIVSSDEPVRTIIDEDGAPAGGPPRKQTQSTGRGVAGLEQKLAEKDASKQAQSAGPNGPMTTADNVIPGSSGITRAQYEAIVAGLGKLFDGGEGRADYVRAAVRRDVNQLKELTGAEADELLTIIAQHTAERAEDDAREREETKQTAATNDDANFS